MKCSYCPMPYMDQHDSNECTKHGRCSAYYIKKSASKPCLPSKFIKWSLKKSSDISYSMHAVNQLHCPWVLRENVIDSSIIALKLSASSSQHLAATAVLLQSTHTNGGENGPGRAHTPPITQRQIKRNKRRGNDLYQSIQAPSWMANCATRTLFASFRQLRRSSVKSSWSLLFTFATIYSVFHWF